MREKDLDSGIERIRPGLPGILNVATMLTILGHNCLWQWTHFMLSGVVRPARAFWEAG